jgi:cytochrome P450
MTISQVPRWRCVQNISKFVDNPIPVLSKFQEEFGDTYYFYLGAVAKCMITSNPKVIQHVLQKNHRNYKKTPLQTEYLARYAGKGLLTNDGTDWLKQRRLIQPGFHKSKITALAQIINTIIVEYVEKIDAYAQSQQSFDITHMMMEFAFKAVAKSLFSTSVSDEEINNLAKNITKIQTYFIKEIRQPYLKWYFQISGLQKAHILLSEKSKEIILQIINERKNSNKTHNDLLDMLLSTRYEDSGEGMTDQQLLDEVIIIFVAGHETSANALTWFFYLIAKHPTVLDKARKEAQTVLKGRVPTFMDLNNLEYGKCCIDETMRLYPPIWITERAAIEDDSVDEISIPKGTIVVPYIYGVHTSKKLWENPEQFNPERFSVDNKKLHTNYSYLPFGGGPRFCIGNNFALMEMQLLTTQLIQRYDFEIVKSHIVEAKPIITLRPKDGIMMTVKKR